MRPAGPACNSPDRQVGFTSNKKIFEVRRTDVVRSSYRSFGPPARYEHSQPRPDSRGYYISVLRTFPPKYQIHYCCLIGSPYRLIPEVSADLSAGKSGKK